MLGCGLLLIVVLGVGGLYGWFSYRPHRMVEAADGRLQRLRNRVPMQWRVARGLTELDEAWMTPTEDEWRAMSEAEMEASARDDEAPEVAVLRRMVRMEPTPPDDDQRTVMRAIEPTLERLARGRLVRPDPDVSGGQVDDVVRWMLWRVWFARDCLTAAIDAVRVAQGHTLLPRQHTGTAWNESVTLRVLEPRLVECAREQPPERLREAAEALLRIDDEREAIVVNLEQHLAGVEQALEVAKAEVRNPWIPHIHVDPTLKELELRLTTAEALADTGSLLDVLIPRGHPQWEELRILRDQEIELRIEYRLLVAALRLIAGDEPDVTHPLSEEPVEHDESYVYWGFPSVDPDGRDEVVMWNPDGDE